MIIPDDLQEMVRQLVHKRDAVTIRAVFDGVGVYCQGLLCAFVYEDTVYTQVGLAGSRKFKSAESKPGKPALLDIPADIYLNHDDFATYVRNRIGPELT